MEELIALYSSFKEEKGKFDVLQTIDCKDDDSLYKYLLHKSRDLKEELIALIEDMCIEFNRCKRMLEYEKVLIEEVNTDIEVASCPCRQQK